MGTVEQTSRRRIINVVSALPRHTNQPFLTHSASRHIKSIVELYVHLRRTRRPTPLEQKSERDRIGGKGNVRRTMERNDEKHHRRTPCFVSIHTLTSFSLSGRFAASLLTSRSHSFLSYFPLSAHVCSLFGSLLAVYIYFIYVHKFDVTRSRYTGRAFYVHTNEHTPQSDFISTTNTGTQK